MALSFVPSRVMILCLCLAGCAGSQTTTGELRGPAETAQSPERAKAVAEIREKAETAAAGPEAGTAPDVYQTHAPPGTSTKSPGEIAAIEAELLAIAEASKQSSNAAELEALRKRAAELEALRRKSISDLDESPNTGSITQ